MKSRQITIDKYFKFLKYIADLQKTKGDLVDVGKLIKEYKLNSCVFAHIVKLGYAKIVSNKTYKILLIKPEPIHAKKLLDSINDDRSKSDSVIQNSKKRTTKSKNLKPKTSNKEFSILWGLVRIKF